MLDANRRERVSDGAQTMNHPYKEVIYKTTLLLHRLRTLSDARQAIMASAPFFAIFINKSFDISTP